MAAKPLDRVVCRTPTPGKKPTTVPRAKFDLVRKAIMAETPRREPGVAFTELLERVDARLGEAGRAAVGSVPWHLTTVKLEMECAGELRRVPGSKPQRLVRTR